jgi:putative RecB family exonuclease
LRLKKPKTAALHVGSTVHEVLKSWNKARWRLEAPTPDDLYRTYEEAWTAEQIDEPVAWDTPADETEKKGLGWRLLETFFRESPIRERGKPDAVEVAVEADLGHGLPTLVGVLDLVQDQKIIDFKTSNTTPNADRAVLIAGTQATAYSMLYRENAGQMEIGIEFHYLVKLKQPKTVVISLPPVGDRERSRLLRVIDAYLEVLDRGAWIPSPGLQCASCEYFRECSGWPA